MSAYLTIPSEAKTVTEATKNEENGSRASLGTQPIFTQPDDPYYLDGRLWGLYGDQSSPGNPFGSQAAEAWARGVTGSTTNVVGIIDTGINYTHPDLYLNIWLNQKEIPQNIRSNLSDVDYDGLITFRDLNAASNLAYSSDKNGNGYIDAGDLLNDPIWNNGVDEDGNGYLDDLIGWDFDANDNDPYGTSDGHGTAVSGVIGAVGGNRIGLTGVNWSIQMMPIKGFGPKSIDYFTNAAINASPTENFIATNNAYTFDGSALLDPIIRAAFNNILFVAAAGNDSRNTDFLPVFPAAFSTQNEAGYNAVIGVSSINSGGQLSSFANYGGTSVDIYAPGSDIWVTDWNGGYISSSGTSYASAFVTGALALYASRFPYATPAQIAAALLASAGQTGGRLDISAMFNIAPSATPFHDVVLGTDQPDVINGQAGDDSIIGGAGADFLTGGAGNDTVEGGLGDDTVSGDPAGSDWAVYSNATSAITINLISGRASGAQGSDSLSGLQGFIAGRGDDSLLGSGINETLDGGLGDDTLMGGGGSSDWISFLTAGGSVTVNLDSGLGFGFAGNDSFAGFEGVIGSPGADSLLGSWFRDTLFGGDGNDTLAGGFASDVLNGGNGHDFVSYAAEASAVTVAFAEERGSGSAWVDNLVSIEGAIGSAFADSLLGSRAAETLAGGAGNDTLAGGEGNGDWVSYAGATNGITVVLGLDLGTGAEGDDAIFGFEGVIGSSFADSISGTKEDDTLAGGRGADTIIGNGGSSDWVSYADFSADLTIDLAMGVAVSDLETDLLSGFRHIIGGEGSDQIHGDKQGNHISGGSGKDILFGWGGADTLDGGAGNDSLYGNEADSLFGAEGSDVFVYQTLDDLMASSQTIDGGTGYDWLALFFPGSVSDAAFLNFRNIEAIWQPDGNSGELILGNLVAKAMSNFIYIENATYVDGTDLPGDARSFVQGSGFADSLTGGSGTDSLIGNDGDDDLLGNGGTDSLTGGEGTDTLFGGMGNDTLAGGFDNDLLIGGGGEDLVSYAGESAAVTVNLEAGRSWGLSGTERLAGIELIEGTAFADSLIGSRLNETFFGAAGNDTLDGAGGLGDWIIYSNVSSGITIDLSSGLGMAPDGVDNIRNIEGVLGSTYADYLMGSAANETFVGGMGADTIVANGGSDWASFAGLKFDLLINLATGFVSNASGADLLLGIGNLIGGEGADIFVGDNQANFLSGGGGGDILTGGLGADTLEGGDGEDFFYASGADSLSGGDGIDAFIFGSVADFRNPWRRIDGGAGFDRIEIMSGENIVDADFVNVRNMEMIWLNTAAPGQLTLASNAAAAMSNGITVRYVRNVDGSALDANVQAVFDGTEGADCLIGGSGADIILGNEGNDRIIGNDGNDILTGGLGADTLVGGDGSDTLDDYLGDDYYDFGAGNDSLDASSLAGSDTLDGGAGNDTLYYDGFDAWAEERQGEWLVYSMPGRSVYLRNWEVMIDSKPIVVLAGNTIKGSGDADTIIAPDLTNVIFGGDGNDLITGGVGADSIFAGPGDDSVNDGSGENFIELGDGSDLSVKRFGTGNDTITGDNGDDTITSWLRNDSIDGGSGNDLISSGEGNDTVVGGRGDDLINADSGDDYLSYFMGDGNDTLDGGEGADTLALEEGDWQTGGDPLGTLYLNTEASILVRNFEAVVYLPSNSSDTLRGSDDTLYSAEHSFRMEGGFGDDFYVLMDAERAVFEERDAGFDTIMAWMDIDVPENIEVLMIARGVAGITVRGGTGNNMLIGNGLANTFIGGVGDDVILAGESRLADIYALFAI